MVDAASMINNSKNPSTILAAVIGILFIAGYFFLVMKSPLVRFLRPQSSQQEVLANAESFFRELPVDHSQLTRRVSVEINQDMLRYAQYYRKENHKFPELSVGYWDISWDKPGYSHQPNDLKPVFYVHYDFKGNLIGFGKREDYLKLEEIKNLSEDDALLEAKYFLESLNIQTNSLIISNKDINKQGANIKYRFTLKNKLRQYPGLMEKYMVEVLGSDVITFQLERTIDTQITGDLSADQSQVIAIILMIVCWIAICFLIVVQFVRRLRRDELEFKRAIGIGLVTAFLLLLLVFLNASGEFMGILIGGGAAGLLGAVVVLIIFPVSEAQCREVCPEKLTVSDLLLQGKVHLREVGTAILRSFLLTGVILLMFGILVLAATTLIPGQLYFDKELLGIFQDFSSSTTVAVKNIVLSLMIGLIILCFWPAYLKDRLKSRTALILTLALTFNLAGLHIIFFRPTYLSFLIVFPIALTWAVIVYRFDLTTTFFSLVGIGFFLKLALVWLTPESLFNLPGMAAIISFALIFVLGLYLIFVPRSAKDYDRYVPEYFSRIAEKERVLKELEIARSVQMRFLPQTVPESPKLEIVSLCQPAMEVGGDYYDFIQLDERYMSILIGDVSGKGVSAAFYMTMIKGIIKTLARKINDPAALLAEANEIFYENAPRNTFITAIYGMFDLKEETLTIASAGHNPLIVWKENKRRTELYNPRGIALGFNRGEVYHSRIREESIPIEPGDIFVFYTDGVSEAMNMNQEIFGEHRLRSIIEQFSHLSPRKLEGKIIESVSEFSGNAPQHDDFTMVIVKIKPKAI